MSYPGSKGQAGTFQRIIGQMPPHSVYVEPFFGSGQVFWRKRRADSNCLIDVDPACHEKAERELTRENEKGSTTYAYCENAVTWLQRVNLNRPYLLIYCDPPYLLSTRGGRRYYKHELTTADHVTLLLTLLKAKCMVMISHPVCPLYLQHLRNWRCVPYKAMTRGGLKPDALWMNFQEPTELHDWRYAGRNFRERCALNRLAARYLARFDRMHPRKRGFIFNTIAQRQDWRGRPAPLASSDVGAGDSVSSGAGIRKAADSVGTGVTRSA